MIDDKPYTFDRVFRIAVTIGVLYGLVRLMARLSDVLIPFVVAFLLAYLLNPVVLWVQDKVRNRVAAVFLTLSGAAAVLALLGVLLVPMVMKEVGHMGQLLGRVVTDSDLAQRAAEKLPPNLWETIRVYAGEERILELVRQRDFWSLAQAVGRKVLPGVWGIVAGTTSFLLGVIGLFVIGLYLVFMLMDYQRLKTEWKQLIPPSWRDPVLGFLREFDASMSLYFRAQAVVAGCVGALFAIGFSLIGLPMGILLGLFVGLLNMVPYLQMVGLVPAGLLAVIMALETGGSVPGALALTGLVFVVVQIIQDAVITPKIMGKVTGLSPAMILLSISVWGKLLGMLGLVIALPATCLILAYYHRLLAESS
ncbi:MAG: AI-2E family transporter [Elusimicrobiota bacterium]